jgi:starch phosphorylase
VTLKLDAPAAPRLFFDGDLDLEVFVQLNGLAADDVRVECVVHRDVCSELTVPVKQYAARDQQGDGIRHRDQDTVFVAAFEPAGDGPGGSCRYRLRVRPPWCGSLRYEVRALPRHRHLSHPYEMGLMRWL